MNEGLEIRDLTYRAIGRIIELLISDESFKSHIDYYDLFNDWTPDDGCRSFFKRK